MNDDLLGDLKNAVIKAQAAGKTLEDFRSEFDDIIAKRGWFTDKLKSASYKRWRTRVIYDTNLRQSYSAGKLAQAKRLDRKYARYVAIQDERGRKTHQAWHGTILPIDNPWWDTHTPMNGWGCRCYVSYLTKAQAQFYLGDKDPDAQIAPPIQMQSQSIRLKSGEVKIVTTPKGISPGFNYNPGASIYNAKTGAVTKLTPKIAPVKPSKTTASAQAESIFIPQNAKPAEKKWLKNSFVTPTAGLNTLIQNIDPLIYCRQAEKTAGYLRTSIFPNGKKTYAVVVGSEKRFSSEQQKHIFRHEYGHNIDRQNKNISFTSLPEVKQDGAMLRANFGKAEKLLNQTIKSEGWNKVKQADLELILPQRILDDNTSINGKVFKNIDIAKAAFLEKDFSILLPVLKKHQKTLKEKIGTVGAVHDLFGSILPRSLDGIGNHNTKYYRKSPLYKIDPEELLSELSTSETFANYVSLRYTEDSEKYIEFFARFLPNIIQSFEKVLK